MNDIEMLEHQIDFLTISLQDAQERVKHLVMCIEDKQNQIAMLKHGVIL